MGILQIAVYHNLPSGGAKRALYEWVRRLADSHQIDVYTLSTADHAFCDIRPFAQEHRVYQFTHHRLFRSPWGRLNRLQRWRDLGRLTHQGHRIAQEINAHDYDVVFAQPCLYTFVPTALRFIQAPSIYYLHEPFGPSFKRHFQRPYSKPDTGWRELSGHLDPLVALYHHRLEDSRTRSLSQTTLFLANSRFTQTQIEAAYKVQAAVCSIGVDTEGFSPMPGVRKENFVVSVGELSPRKGFDFLVESLSHVPPDRRPILKLVCNSVNPPERQFVEALAVRHNVELSILIGLNSDQLALEYNRAQLCLYAPVSEPLGLVPLESMACGTPVVGVAEGGVRETVLHGETGILTERDPARFAQAVLTLLDDAETRRRYGIQGRAYVEQEWQWDDSVRRLENHLLHVAGRTSTQQGD